MTTTEQDATHRAETKRRMRYMLIFLGVLFGAVFLYKTVMGLLMAHFMSSQSRVVTVSTMKVGYAEWSSELHAVGNVRAIRGVNVTTELAGLVRSIYFSPGAAVTEGTVLAELNIDSDLAQLRALQATAELDKITYNRDKAQFAIKGVSKEVVDTAAATLKNILAQIEQQQSIISKKIIRAPFTGRLGISQINPGQYLNPGDSIVTLQQLDPIYVDFFIPQQDLPKLQAGQAVTIVTDTYPGKQFQGTITTINPLADNATRNVEIEATIQNPDLQLVPGLFVSTKVNTGKSKRFLTLPQTAISFNAYGDIIYLVEEDAKKHQIVQQSFVTEGDARGEQVAILTGLKEGDVVVTSGQLKLKNGDQITVDNKVAPSNSANPKLLNSH